MIPSNKCINPVRLPSVMLKVTMPGRLPPPDGQPFDIARLNPMVEGICDHLGEQRVALSEDRWKEVGFVWKCSRCGTDSRLVWANGIAIGEQRVIVFVPDKMDPEVSMFPVVLLSIDHKGEYTVVGTYNVSGILE